MFARILIGLMVFACGAVAFGETYPERPIRLIVSYPPGGGTDVTARTIVGRLSEGLGRQVVIDNRPGAGSTIGTDLVAKATPDGYTLLMSDTTFGIVPGLYSKLPYDALRDFRPVMAEAGVPGVVAVAWFDIHAPRATLKTVVARLHAEAVKTLQDLTIKQRFATEGADAVGSSPRQFTQFVADGITKWTKVVKDGGIKAEF